MEFFNHLRIPRLLALALVLSVAAACDDSSGPAVDGSDPEATEAAMANVTNSLVGNEGLESFGEMSPFFASVFGVTPAIVPSATGIAQIPAGMHAIAVNSSYLLERERLGLQGPVIPDQYLGTTFEWDELLGGYAPSQRAGAPTDGVRFILYAINPVTRQPIVDTEVGHVDLVDTSDQSANGLATTVVVDGVTLISYNSTCGFTATQGGIQTLTVATAGFVSDGTRQMNFDLSLSFSDQTGVVLDLSVDIPSDNIQIDFVASGSDFADEGDDIFVGAFDMSFDISRGTNGIGFDLAGDAQGALTGQVEICGGSDGRDCAVVALISGTFDSPVITDAGGNELGPDGIGHLANLFDHAGDFVGHFLEFLSSAFFLCFISFAA